MNALRMCLRHLLLELLLGLLRLQGALLGLVPVVLLSHLLDALQALIRRVGLVQLRV